MGASERWSGPKRMSSFWSLFYHDTSGQAVADLTLWDDGKVTFHQVTGTCSYPIPGELVRQLLESRAPSPGQKEETE